MTNRLRQSAEGPRIRRDAAFPCGPSLTWVALREELFARLLGRQN